MEKVKNVIKSRKVQLIVGSAVIGGVAYAVIFKSHASRYPFGSGFIATQAGPTPEAVVVAKAATKSARVPKAPKVVETTAA